MADSSINNNQSAETVALTLKVSPEVYQAFHRKAEQAGLDVETFLGNTLTIVLGCRAFNEKYADSPAAARQP